MFEWAGVNHYFAPSFFVWVGFDPFNSGWTGQADFVRFNLGEGAFRASKDYSAD